MKQFLIESFRKKECVQRDKSTESVVTYQLREFFCVDYADVTKFDVEVLVDRVQCPGESDIVLELHRNLLPHQGLEE
jgi:hypothetical protein